jgi:hypothetical protein
MSTILDIMVDMAGAMVSTKEVIPGDYPYMCPCAPRTSTTKRAR